MIEISEQKNKKLYLRCGNCKSNYDVKILKLQYNDHSGNMIYLCRDCREKLMKLLFSEYNRNI